MGKNARINTIWVTWGYNTKEELRLADADQIINDPSELVKILKECLTGDRQAINYIVLILIATLPAVLVGLLFNSEVKSFYNINSVSYCLLITGEQIWKIKVYR